MKCRLDKILVLLAVIAVGGWTAAFVRPAAGGEPPSFNIKLPPDAKAAVTASQALRALPVEARCKPGKLVPNDEISRGWVSRVYAKVAPATVVIHCGDGVGSGFLISSDGWIVTNHHVIEDAPIDSDTAALVATVYLGRMGDEGMEIDEKGIDALVYKSSEEKDLALLKLKKLPDDVDALPCLDPADTDSIERGTRCAAIGHPKAGMLWTIRSGEVVNMGLWPDDKIPAVMARLTSSGAREEELGRVLASIPKRKIVISSCGLNPGDSGGPLVNSKGEVIGVTFAIPKGGTEEGYSLDKFSYHLGLEEINDFVDEEPEKPQPYVPNPWTMPALVSGLVDKDGNNKWDLAVFALNEEDPPTGFLIDLDQDSPEDFESDDLEDAEKREAWNFEFAFQRVPLFRTFYDADNDGTIDVSLTDADDDGVSDITLKLKEGTWEKVEVEDQAMIDADLFEDEAIRQRFIELVVKPVQQPDAPEEGEEPAENPETPKDVKKKG